VSAVEIGVGINGCIHNELNNPCIVTGISHQPFTHIEFGDPLH
jgi:hypothetical protein